MNAGTLVLLASLATIGVALFAGDAGAAVLPSTSSATKPPPGGVTPPPRRGSGGASRPPAGNSTGFDRDLRAFQQAQNAWQLGLFSRDADALAARSGRPAPILTVDGLWGPYTASAFQRVAQDLGIVARTPDVVALLARTRSAGAISAEETRQQIMRLAEGYAAIASSADWQRADKAYLIDALRRWTGALRSCCSDTPGIIAATVRDGRGTNRDLRITNGRAFRPGAQ